MRTKSENKRQAIVDVATQVFSEFGFERTSMSEICARVGGSKATLYNHFASKEELFIEVVFRSFDREFEAIYGDMESGAGEFTEVLRNFGKHLLRIVFAPEFIPFRRLTMGDSAPRELRRMAFENGPKRGNARLAMLLGEAMQRGHLRVADATVAAWQLMALLQAEVFYPVLMDARDGMSDDEVEDCVRHAVDVFMRAYAPEGKRS